MSPPLRLSLFTFFRDFFTFDDTLRGSSQRSYLFISHRNLITITHFLCTICYAPADADAYENYKIIRESTIGDINYIAMISFCLALITDCYTILAILLVLLLPIIYTGLFVVKHNQQGHCNLAVVIAKRGQPVVTLAYIHQLALASV